MLIMTIEQRKKKVDKHKVEKKKRGLKLIYGTKKEINSYTIRIKENSNFSISLCD
jgi:hypothetical protein